MQTMIDLRGISTNWFKNQFCPFIRLSFPGYGVSGGGGGYFTRSNDLYLTSRRMEEEGGGVSTLWNKPEERGGG
jgi:hypothetical protein